MNRDRLTRERRSWNMSRIRGKDTTPERIVRSVLHRLGYRFRLHVKIPVQGMFKVQGSKFKVGRAVDRSSKFQASKLQRSSKIQIPNSKLRQGRHSALSTPSSALRTLVVRPDIVLPKYKTAIFVHGCFWHRHRGCKNCTTPTHRRTWWLAKLEGNAARDKKHQRALRKLGWRVIVIWECKAGALEKLNTKLLALLP